MNPKYNVDFVFITYFIFQCLCLKINALLSILCVFSFFRASIWRACLSVSPLIGCTGSSILHRESSILRCLPAYPIVCAHIVHGQRASASFLCDHWIGRRPPRGACAWVQHPVGLERDRPAASRSTKRLLSPLGFPPKQILQWAPAVPATRVLDRMGTLGTVHGPVWGWYSSHANLREWSHCAGCNVVSSPHP